MRSYKYNPKNSNEDKKQKFKSFSSYSHFFLIYCNSFSQVFICIYERYSL